MMMARHLLLVVSNPVEGRDEEYNRWYSERHLRDVVGVDGFVSAERYRVLSEEGEKPLGGKYAAIYEIESDDPRATLAQLSVLAEAGKMEVSDAMVPDGMTLTLLTPIASYP
jgi:hypothetical protein